MLCTLLYMYDVVHVVWHSHLYTSQHLPQVHHISLLFGSTIPTSLHIHMWLDLQETEKSLFSGLDYWTTKPDWSLTIRLYAHAQLQSHGLHVKNWDLGLSLTCSSFVTCSSMLSSSLIVMINIKNCNLYSIHRVPCQRLNQHSNPEEHQLWMMIPISLTMLPYQRIISDAYRSR